MATHRSETIDIIRGVSRTSSKSRIGGSARDSARARTRWLAPPHASILTPSEGLSRVNGLADWRIVVFGGFGTHYNHQRAVTGVAGERVLRSESRAELVTHIL